jgi:hypothetical protein
MLPPTAALAIGVININAARNIATISEPFFTNFP